MKKLALLMAFLLAFSALAGAAFAEETKHIDVLRVAVPSIPANLDPATGIGNNNLMMYFNIYDTIMFTDWYRDGSLTSYICEGFDVIDPYTTEFKIKEGITFQNGDPLTAEDIKFTIDRIVFGDLSYVGATIYTLFVNIEAIEVVDTYTVRIKTYEPDPAMASRLSSSLGIYVVPKGYVEEVGNENFGQAPIGTGPYKVTSFSPEKVVMEYYEGYYGERPAADTVEYLLYPEVSTRLTALMTGEIDICFNLTPDNVDQVVSTPGLHMDIKNVASLHLLCYNSSVEPMDDVNLRKALNYSIDRELLADMLWGGYAQTRNGYNLPEYGSYYVPDYPEYEYNLEKAKEFLAASDYAGETITYQLNSNYYTLGNEVAEAIVSVWNSIGIHAVVEYSTSWVYDSFHVHNWSNGPRFLDPVAGLWLLWGKDTNAEKYYWKNAVNWDEFAELGDLLATSFDFQERYAANLRMMEIFDNDCIGTVLFQTCVFSGLRDGIELAQNRDVSVSFRAEHLSIK